MGALAIFAITGLGLAALALFNGILSMAHGGEEAQRVAHVLMFKRVAWQAAAVLFVLLALLANLA